MRLLFVTPFVPTATAGHGGGAYLWALASALAAKVELGLVTLGDPPATGIGTPWRWAGAATDLGPPPRHGKLRHRLRMLRLWGRLPLVAAKAWQPALPPLLQRARREFAPDVACVEMAQMAQYLPYLEGLPTIFTDHEAGCPANAATGLGALADRRDQRLWQGYIRRHYLQATRLQAVSSEDGAALAAALGRPVHLRSATVAIPDLPVTPANAPARALFLGDYRHAPNPEAARRLVVEVLPRLREQLPSTELWLAGQHSEAIADLATRPGVRVLGFVPDLHGLLSQVRLLLAPLWSGAGFRVKAATALAHGLPVVTNRLGNRGLEAPAPACTEAESAAQLASAALHLLRDPSAAGAAGAAARDWAERHLAAAAIAAQQIAAAQALCRT
jgi:hypothetical protein